MNVNEAVTTLQKTNEFLCNFQESRLRGSNCHR